VGSPAVERGRRSYHRVDLVRPPLALADATDLGYQSMLGQ
jgi:hypothetical protein